MKQPNFLFIICDQLRADHLGCYGNPVVQTPHIDGLAARGARFDRAYVAYPVCMPNRACLMTGRMASDHRGINNGIPLDLEATTFVDVLAHHGYRTGLIGKSHLQGYTPLDPMYGYIADDELTPPPEELQDALRRSRWTGGGYRIERRIASGELAATPYTDGFYGFQHVELVTRHADFTDGHHLAWAEKQRPDFKTLVGKENALPDHRPRGPQAWRTSVPPELYSTQFIANRSRAYIEESAHGDQPFFLQISFTDPHHPFTPPGKYWDMYDPDDFEVELPYEAHQNPTPPMQWMDEQWQQGNSARTKTTARRLGKQQLREAMALTAGMITMVDDEVGRLIEVLKETGQYENTVICFNSDHGDYLGDFSLLLKGALPFRSVTDVPMIWSDPTSREGRVTEALASTIDLSATILDRACLAPYNGMQGQSFMPVIDGADDHHEAVMCEFNDLGARLGFERPARVRGIRTANWRFTLYQGEAWGELYDLATDPRETNNLWASSDHASIKAELTLQLAHMLAGQMDESPISRLMA